MFCAQFIRTDVTSSEQADEIVVKRCYSGHPSTTSSSSSSSSIPTENIRFSRDYMPLNEYGSFFPRKKDRTIGPNFGLNIRLT